MTTLKNRQLTINLAEGQMLNGKLSVTVATNNLTVALKTLAGNDATASDPIYAMIGGALRTISSALSVTKNAGTNWCNAGSAELATKEIDYFAYLGYNATDGVTIGFSRIPYACQYSDFSTTTTNEKYCAISTITNATATDYYNVIGRFAATLSAGAGYTWSVPTFTAINLIQRPIWETRWLIYQPVYSCSGSMTYTSVVTYSAKYRISGKQIYYKVFAGGTTGGTASNEIRVSYPFEPITFGSSYEKTIASITNNAVPTLGLLALSTGYFRFQINGAGNWTLAASTFVSVEILAEI